MSPLPVGILGSARVAANTIGPARVKVFETGGATGSTSHTVTFDEPTALGNTYLLVCVITTRFVTITTAPTAAGWTQGGASGTHTSVDNHRIYALRGDGTTNSVTLGLSATGGDIVITLLAFAGYVSATPSLSQLGATNNGSSYTFAPTSLPSISHGVALASLGLQASSNPNDTWTNGYVSLQSAASKQRLAWKDYTGAGGSYGTVTNWGTARNYRSMFNVYELT